MIKLFENGLRLILGAPSTVIHPKVMIDFISGSHPLVANKLIFNNLSSDDVAKAILGLKLNAVGVDGIYSRILQLSLPYCPNSITHLINQCLRQSVVPDLLKKPIFTALLKVSKTSRFYGLMLIGITPVLSKVL